ncbi:hypothetical protein P8R33_03830 [Qipengyuania sp. XHP0211]|uniref:hypothetical protein n=1 Tax=Qipengyuania sp. XHP0211 TaxID=3038079 RepID=UPI00241DFD88|nr:hypothetical protein [Qipengyuania sp. XHP0211]MDG5750229.1 hypothetical protein [Qipengyuania sp. XHP0211]
MTSETVTWIGTAFSILGAGIAIWQAHRARTAAEKVEAARKQIVGRYQHGELGALDGVLSAALSAMEKYGPGSSVTRLIGASADSDANAVRAFTAALDRNTEMLTKAFGGHCVQVRDRINRLLDEFGAAQTDGGRLPKGKAIYLEISTFSGNIKKALDAGTFADEVATD